MAQLTAAEEAELAALEAELVGRDTAEEKRIAMATAAARAGGGGFIMPPNQPADFTSKELAPAALRYGVPLAAGIAAGPVTGLAALTRAALIGGGAAGAGEAGAQTVEKLAEGQEYRPGQIIGATVRGAAPMFKEGPGKTILTSGLTGLLGGAAEGKVEGFKSGAYEAGVSALGPAFVEAVGGVGRNLGRFFSRGVSRAEDIERIGPGVEATLGQAFPELAGLESRVAAQTGSQALKERLNQQAEAITRAVVGVSGMPAETYPDIVRRVASTMSNMDPASIERLANEADAVNTARNAVEKARTGAQKSLLQESLSEAENEFRKRIDLETMAGGIKAGGVQPFQSAAMGREVETVFDDARKAFRQKSEELYAPTRPFEDAAAFDITAPPAKGQSSLRQDALDLMSRIPDIPAGGLTELKKLLSRRKVVSAPYSPDPTAPITVSVPEKASLAELRAIRDELYQFADYSGEAMGKNAQREIRNLGQRITDTIDAQADSAFGAANSQALREANDFYSKFRPRFDEFGVIQAFKPERMETAQMAESVRGRVAKQGVETPAFQNAITLLDDLKAAGTQGVPDSKKLADITRSGIVDRSLNTETRELNLRQLASDLNNIEQQSPGGLAKLGFGTTQELKRFVRFVTGLENAEKVGPEKIVQLLNTETPAGFAVASRAVQTLPDVATVDSVISALQKRAVGGSKMAKETLDSIRAREIEDLLLEVRGGRRGAATGAVGILADPTERDRIERILGPKLLSDIEKTFIPGFRVMEEAREAAGLAGSPSRGAAFERAGKKIAELPIQIGAGKGASGVLSMLSSMADLGTYALVSKAIAKGAGVSGMRSRRDFFNEMARIAELPQPSQLAALRRYAGEDETER
jgi:hypothetical protein